MTKAKRSKHSFPVAYKRGFLKTLDQRTGVARALREMRDAIVADLGGSDQLSVLQHALIEEAVWTHYRLRELRRRMAEGEDVDGVYGQLVNTFSGLAAKLGLRRKARDVHDLQAYLEQRKDTAGDGKP
jgi:hypothetical protein